MSPFPIRPRGQDRLTVPTRPTMPTVNPVPLPAAPRTHTRLGPRHEPRPSLCRHPRAPGRGAVCFLVPFTLRPPTPGVCQSPTISRACSMGTPAVTSDPIARDNTPTSACLGNANARSGYPIASPTCSAMIAPSAGSVVSRNARAASRNAAALDRSSTRGAGTPYRPSASTSA